MRRLPRAAMLLEKPQGSQLLQFPQRRAVGYPRQLSKLGIVDPSRGFCMPERLLLPLIQTVFSENRIRQPVSPDRGGEFTTALNEVGFRQRVGNALAYPDYSCILRFS